jgi:hypothetical protein
MKSSIVIFDQFTDIDLFLMWDLLNSRRLPGVAVSRRMGHRKESRSRMEAPHIEIDQTGWGRPEFRGRPRPRKALRSRSVGEQLS